MAERRARARWSLGSTILAPLGVGAVGAAVIGLVWIIAGDGKASGRAGGGANADTQRGSEARGRAVRWDGARLLRGTPDRLTLYLPAGRQDGPMSPARGRMRRRPSPPASR